MSNSSSCSTPSDLKKSRDSTIVTELRPHDVMMGRGLQASEYEGNKRLRRMVQSRREAYVQAKSREGKQKIAQEIIAAIRVQGGRFLRRHVAFLDGQARSVWQSIEEPEEMIGKVKQLLRDMAPEVKQRRVQRRRRQAEWTRQNAYTTMFPDVLQCPFQVERLSSSSVPLLSCDAVNSRGTVATQIERPSSTPLPSTIAALLNTRPCRLDQLHQGAPTTTSTIYECNPPSLTLPAGSSSLNEFQLLLLRQREREQNQEQKIDLDALNQEEAASRTRAAVTILSSLLTSAAPTSRVHTHTTNTSASLREPRHSSTPSPYDLYLQLVLSELQRHPGSAPQLLPTGTASQRLMNPMDLVLPQHSDEHTTNTVYTNTVTPNSPAHSISPRSSDNCLRNLSDHDVARLAWFEQLHRIWQR